MSGARLRKPKKFRFQLLADFIVATFDVSMRVADVGGGKGFLTYLLRGHGYGAFVKRTLSDIRRGQPPVADLSDLQSAMRIIDAGYRAAATGTSVPPAN